MKKFGVAVLAAASLAGASAQSAQGASAPPAPCESQRALFEKYNIEINLYSEELSYAYNTACGVTG